MIWIHAKCGSNSVADPEGSIKDEGVLTGVELDTMLVV